MFDKIFGLNLNKHIRTTMFSIEEFHDKGCTYWFDTKSYKVLGVYRWLPVKKQQEIDQNRNQYLLFPQYIYDSRCYEMIKIIDNPKVTAYFNEANNEEELFYRYRCFIDYNGIELSEWYYDQVSALNLLLQWCKDNEIKYRYKPIKPPKKFFYTEYEMKQIKWSFPEK